MTGMNDVDHAMLLILSLDAEAHVTFSEYTRKWFVSARIEISDGAMLTGITEHAPTPDVAVLTYFGRMKAVDSFIDRVLVTDANSPASRRHWRWNGAAFVEVPRWNRGTSREKAEDTIYDWDACDRHKYDHQPPALRLLSWELDRLLAAKEPFRGESWQEAVDDLVSAIAVLSKQRMP